MLDKLSQCSQIEVQSASSQEQLHQKLVHSKESESSEERNIDKSHQQKNRFCCLPNFLCCGQLWAFPDFKCNRLNAKDRSGTDIYQKSVNVLTQENYNYHDKRDKRNLSRIIFGKRKETESPSESTSLFCNQTQHDKLPS